MKRPLTGVSAAERIRASARELFYNNGIRSVGVEEIVQNAGVTKPSLYRAYESKDGLVAVYLDEFFLTCRKRFEEAEAACPDDPRGQLLFYFDGLAERASHPAYRGCGLTNAILEFPNREHPIRREAARLKQAMADWISSRVMLLGKRDPEVLTSGLVLLMEGAFVAGQAFAPPGPGAHAGMVARLMLDA
ncbi:TetR/AcrR family transcriptional regulator [Acetobacter okinawensis]|uniref:TetR/AcrR family transcriptional regulator n=1 Tax=Acetobacter okinawensis TaxID=1076594 RepID=UPI001BA866A0|nr:TetR/AcrR family transcriptional regulator [Acetobacter okinawensis]MBS0964551.1 TetR/AcrR family transcriptional regulator [Acetobacter okinawensis]